MSARAISIISPIRQKRSAEDTLNSTREKVLRYANVSKVAASFDPERPVHLDAQCNAYLIIASSHFGQTWSRSDESPDDEQDIGREDLYLRERDLDGFLECRAQKLANREDQKTYQYLNSTAIYLSKVFTKFASYRDSNIPAHYKHSYVTTIEHMYLLEIGLDQLVRKLLDPDDIFEQYDSDKQNESVSIGGKALRVKKREVLMGARLARFLGEHYPRIQKIATIFQKYSRRRFLSMKATDKKRIIQSCFEVAKGFKELHIMITESVFSR